MEKEQGKPKGLREPQEDDKCLFTWPINVEARKCRKGRILESEMTRQNALQSAKIAQIGGGIVKVFLKKSDRRFGIESGARAAVPFVRPSPAAHLPIGVTQKAVIGFK